MAIIFFTTSFPVRQNNSLTVVGHEYDLEREFYVIHLETNLVQNVFVYQYVVSMTFTAVLNDKLAGFYRSSYEDADGETAYLGITQFQATDARRSFPCLDEPDLKADFRVRLAHQQTMVARSNMNAESTEPMDGEMEGWNMTTYAESVRMPTYLVAFMVADFGYTEGVDNADFNIWHMKTKAGQGDLVKLLWRVTTYSGTPIPDGTSVTNSALNM